MNARLPICTRSGRIDLRLTPETNGLGGMMIKTQGLTHIHLVVRDLDRALNFYTNVFGLEERFRDGPKMVFLNTPGSKDLITLNEDASEEHHAGVNAGVAHFGFRREGDTDLDTAIAEVEKAGGKLVERG
ncbi:MAG: VOC family protein, partial [Gammaproteobacteria bacterium]